MKLTDMSDMWRHDVIRTVYLCNLCNLKVRANRMQLPCVMYVHSCHSVKWASETGFECNCGGARKRHCHWARVRSSPFLLIILKPSPHQKQCRSNIAECYKSNDSFDKVERCFDIVALSTRAWCSASRAFVGHSWATCWQHCRTKFRHFDKVETKLNMFNLFRLCRKDEILRKTRSTSLPDFVEKIVRLVAFDNVASTAPNGTHMNSLGVIQNSIKSHLYPVASFAICNFYLCFV